MPALPLQFRLEPHHVAAIDVVCLVTDPQSGLTVTLSRQQVIVGILDQWIAARQPPPPVSPAPISIAAVQPEPSLADIGRQRPEQAAPPFHREVLVSPDALAALDRAALAERARELRKTLSHSKIAAMLNAEGVPTLGYKPGARWSNSAVERLEKFGL